MSKTRQTGTPVEAPRALTELIDRFESQRGLYRSRPYNEAQLRREFVDPLLGLLGWDVTNARGIPDPYKDVVHEDSIKVGGVTKAPDYCLRVGGSRRIFVEVKKPGVNIGSSLSPAFQLRRYAWSANLPVSILTDFEEFAIYDCRVEPHHEDGAAVARIGLFSFQDYSTVWSELSALFSRDAVYSGALETYVREHKQPRGTAEVNRAFLLEIEKWRSFLAENVADLNPTITQRELNFAVQRTIDRVIFLRIAEDRGIEDYGTLQRVAEGYDVYQKLLRLFVEADVRYNSGLFQFQPAPGRHEEADTLTPSLTIEDAPLRKIVERLYFPQSPYEFSVIPAEILGHVYEQFLGRVIVLSSQHEASVEEKPEVKKSGGVYYTPSEITSYIVEETVGRLFAGRRITPRGRRPGFTILDPACGSGSFLIAAYQYLLDWYLGQYLEDPASFPKAVYETPGGWRLTIAERKKILLDHIYGVDVDAQAVETTKLSLLLKVLEGESSETIGQNLKLFAEPALPDLGDNIKSGNSLIGPEFFQMHQLGLLAEEEVYRLNPFAWKEEFPDVFDEDASGFDAVIGNPPYLSYSGRQAIDLPPPVRKHLFAVHETAGWPTAHGFFIEAAVKKLSRRYVSFIVPDQVGHLAGYGEVRRILRDHAGLLDVRYWGEEVFEDAVTPALTFVAAKGEDGETTIHDREGRTRTRRFIGDEPWIDSANRDLATRLREDSFSLGDLVADPGVHTGNASKQLILAAAEATPGSVPVLEGKQVARYACSEPAKVLRLDYTPAEKEYFTIRPEERYRRAEFVIRQTAAYPIVGPRRHAVYFRNSLLALYPPDHLDIRYLVGVLNSTLMRFLYRTMVQEAGQRAFPQVKVKSVRALPIRRVDLQDSASREKYDQVLRLVSRLLELNEELLHTRTDQDRVGTQRQIRAADRELDAVVYDLYGVTADEAQTIELDDPLVGKPIQ